MGTSRLGSFGIGSSFDKSGEVDLGNSTTGALLAAGVFTGTARDVSGTSVIYITVYSDVASATDGLHIQMSSDSTTWRSGTGDTYTIPAATEKTFSVQAHTNYMRVVYTNGGTDQADFDLQVLLKKYNGKPSSHKIQDAIIGEDDAELVKSVLTGLTPAGSFVNASLTNGGNFKVSLEELETGISSNSKAQLNVTPFDATGNELVDCDLGVPRGLYSNMFSVNKYGRAENGIQVTPSDIWDRADAAATQQIWLAPTAARIHAITSTSTADDGTPEGAGAGAQAVRIWGLQTWASSETSEDVVLNGTANVNTANSYVIIHRMKIIPVGTTYAINAGVITATAATDGTVTAQISIGVGQTLMAIYGIPSTQKAYMPTYTVNSHDTANPSTSVEADFTMLVNERPDLSTTVFLNKSNIGAISSGTTMAPRVFKPFKKIEGPAIIKFQAISTAADTEGSVEFDLVVVNN